MNQGSTALRTNLDEVSFIRPILIILLVLYHSLCIHTGNWRTIEGMNVIPAYREIGRLAYSFMLECFVFVSGYVWAYQRETLGKKEGFLLLCKKKAMRLIVPYILFGFLYMLLFMHHEFNILGIIEGSSHLWFLLMLFWCFLIGWCILQFKLSPKIVIPVLYLISIIRPIGLPLRLSQTLYYLPFFFLGYYIYEYYDWLREKLKGWHLVVSWGGYIIVYGVCLILSRELSMGWRSGQFCVLIYSSLGTIALLITAIYITGKITIKEWYVKIGSLCMGVYIFQQFILQAIYYYSPLPFLVPDWALPLIGFVVALLFSLVLTYLIRLSKLGKKIL